MTFNINTRPQFSFDDALTAIIDYATALRSDSTASDSTLDELQRDLDLMLDHASSAPLDADDPDERRNPDFSTFPTMNFAELSPELAYRTAIRHLDELRTIADHLFDFRD